MLWVETNTSRTIGHSLFVSEGPVDARLPNAWQHDAGPSTVVVGQGCLGCWTKGCIAPSYPTQQGILVSYLVVFMEETTRICGRDRVDRVDVTR